MKRTRTIVGVSEVATSFESYQSPFGQSEAASGPVEQFRRFFIRQDRGLLAVFVAAVPLQTKETDCLNWLRRVLRSGVAWSFAAFFGTLPSRGSEIGCKLQYNSR
jgi:hypothetical protein